MPSPRVKEILLKYKSLGIQGVYKYLNDDNIDLINDSWAWKIKKLLDEKQVHSAECEIASLLFTFKLLDNDK